MDASVTETPRELMRQVAMHMGSRYKDVTLTVPRRTNWVDVMHEVEAKLAGNEEDEKIILSPSRTEAQRNRFRHIALEGAAGWQAAKSVTESGVFPPGLYDASSIPIPKPMARKKENMIPMGEPWSAPFPVILTASADERTLPMVRASVVVKVSTMTTTISHEIRDTWMLWDTGAQSTIIGDGEGGGRVV